MQRRAGRACAASGALRAAAVAAVLLRCTGAQEEEKRDDGTCAAGDASCGAGVSGQALASPYIWPMARGPIGSHGTSPHKAPRNLSASLAFSWHPLERRLGPISNGALLVDDKMNLYVGFSTGIYKFSPDFRMLWVYAAPYNDIPALMDGKLFTTITDGHIHAISMESGTLLWKSRPVCTWSPRQTVKHPSCNCAQIGVDIAAVGAHKGIVVVRTTEPMGGGACSVAALNATDGAFLWDYAVDHLLWNFYPIFNDDGESFLFQDSAGGVYHLGLDGREIWKVTNSEAWFQTWTDGGLMLGPNGVAYAMKGLGPQSQGGNRGPGVGGVVRAYRVADGEFLWESQRMPDPPNSWPAIGRLREGDPLTVMAPYGVAGGSMMLFEWRNYIPAGWWQSPLAYVLDPFFGIIVNLGLALGDWSQYMYGHRDHQPEVWGLDAATGKILWKWSQPVWKRGATRGDYERIAANSPICTPNPCGNPTLDAAGTFYIGMMDGNIYALAADSNGPGVREVSTFDAESAFSNGGTTIAPGMMAIVSCDTLFVFKEK